MGKVTQGNPSNEMGDGPEAAVLAATMSVCSSSHFRDCEPQVRCCATCPAHVCDFCMQEGHCPHCIRGRALVVLLVIDISNGFSLMTGHDDTQDGVLQVPFMVLRANESLS